MLHVSQVANIIYDTVTKDDSQSWVPKASLYVDVKEVLTQHGHVVDDGELKGCFNEAFRMAFRQFVNHGPLAEITSTVGKIHQVHINQGMSQ